ncbi:MAG TPA: hypothetical protein VGF97_09740 [Rhizomicrobium sp.]
MTRLLCLLCLLLPGVAMAQVSVTTWHYDLARTGSNPIETALTTKTVNTSGFGKVCSYPVDGQIYAEPLYVPGLTIGGGKHDVAFVATEHDSVYAFDAECNTPKPLWQTSFLGSGITTMPCTSDRQPQCDVTIMSPEHGISPTPVIDVKGGTIYVAAQSVESGAYTQKLHALDIASGAEKAGSPVVISGSAPNNPSLHFDPEQAFQRAGLLLLNGVVYVPFASNDSANGWMFGYDAATLAQKSIFSVTPNGSLGGIWGGGAAPAVDAADNIYLGTGNGSFDANTGGADYGMSALRMVPAGNTLSVTDYFAPSKEQKLSKRDLDLDSGGLILLADQPGSHTHEAVIGFKTGEFFLIDRDHMGGLGTKNAVQAFTANRGGIYSSAATWNGNVYLAGVDGVLNQWTLQKGVFPSSPTHQTSVSYSYPGATPSISSNKDKDGIVWTIATDGKVQGGKPAVLYANDARDISVELYDSNQAGKRDIPGAGVKFTVPTIADGKVFIGTQTELDIYGLLPHS